MKLEGSKALIDAGWNWLNMNASPEVGLCGDRSCIRCRLVDMILEIEELDRKNLQKEESNA